jgi:hypothetical protein
MIGQIPVALRTSREGRREGGTAAESVFNSFCPFGLARGEPCKTQHMETKARGIFRINISVYFFNKCFSWDSEMCL